MHFPGQGTNQMKVTSVAEGLFF